MLDVTAMEHLMGLERKGLPDLVREIERFRADVKSELKGIGSATECYSKQLQYQGRSENAALAIDRVLSSWDVLARVDAVEGTSVSWGAASGYLRQLALTAAYSAEQQRVPSEVRDALDAVIAALLQRRFLGDGWTQRVADAFGLLQEAWRGGQSAEDSESGLR